MSFGLVQAQQNLPAKRFDMSSLNRTQILNHNFNSVNSSSFTAFSTQEDENELEPLASLNTEMWGIINYTEGVIYYSAIRTADTSIEIKTYDNDFEVVESFSVEIPANANYVEVLNHYSINFFEENTKEFMLYVHYFDEEIMGPEGQISEIRIVDANGNILGEVSGEAAWAKTDAEGNKKLITYTSGEDEDIITAYNPGDFEVEDQYIIDGDLLNYFAGIPFNFYRIDGEEKMVLAHYESIFMDNATLEVFPDNNLIIKILDLNFEEENSFTLDIQSDETDLGMFVIPMADFGKFYKDQRYDISREYFDSSDDFKIVYGLEYYDMMADVEWNTYRVAKEDGTIIHELNEEILEVNADMTPIEGFDNQLGFLLGQDGQAVQLGFFDIESWEMVKTFDAEYNGDLLSDNFNRIPSGDTYHFVVGLGQPDMIEGDAYGVINQYDLDGELVERHQFQLPENAILFQPILTSAFLSNTFTTEDDDFYFSYVYLESAEDGTNFYNLVFAKDSENILHEFRGDTEKGRLNGADLVLKSDGESFDKLAVLYDINSNIFLTEFYRIPFEGDMSTDDFHIAELSLYPNPTAGIVHIKSDANIQKAVVYNLNGQVVQSEYLNNTQNSFDISKLSKGMYVIQLQFENGSSQHIKVLKQ